MWRLTHGELPGKPPKFVMMLDALDDLGYAYLNKGVAGIVPEVAPLLKR